MRNITCIGRALPVPSMNWYRGEQYLANSDTYRITQQQPAADTIASTLSVRHQYYQSTMRLLGWLTGSRVVSVLDSGAVGRVFKSQPRRCRVTVLGKLLTPIVSLFTKQRNR